MSNTGSGKKLASFNCEQKMWEKFIACCRDRGTTATATLTSFIELYLDDSTNDLDEIAVATRDRSQNSQIQVRANHSSSEINWETISAIHARLERLESDGEKPVNQSSDCLEAKIQDLTTTVKQLREAMTKIQNYLNNQPRRSSKTNKNSSVYQSYTNRIQPLTEEALAVRLGVDVASVRQQRDSLPPALFVGWSKGKDRSGVGWEWNESIGLYQPAT
ncbi:hypothetical protein [Nostoc sp. FACHB-110]|uniref:hypothetical protein n=1 Tax=Nostoc sp. FACHB-110 TaxID=2692834 RepID=UPI001F54BC5F|nr:hypothetical protein [Nostoc sp. FACHB-110]